MNNIEYMKLAIAESKKALEINEIPVGAIIVENNVVIGNGYNQKENLNDTTKHAEIIALSKAFKIKNNWRLDNAIVYTTLFPCPMCASAIQQSRIKKVYYLYDNTNLESKDISTKILNLNPKVELIKIKNAEFDNYLKAFFESIR